MFDMKGINNIKKIKWQELKPGMIVIGGVQINDAVPEELRDFPVLTESLLNDLILKYRFLTNRDIIVAGAITGFSPKEISNHINLSFEKVQKINNFRETFFTDKTKLLSELKLDINPDIPIIGTEHIEKDYLIKDTYNSFNLDFKEIPEGMEMPSFFNRTELRLTLGDLLTNRLKPKFNIPEDKDVLLHLVVDYSYSLNTYGKFDIVVSALNYFYSYIVEFLLNTKIKLYVFSDICKPVDYPLEGREIERKETNYASFMKKVLHFKDKSVHNKVILFTDGQPSDFSEAMRLANLFKKNKLDYTQLIFKLEDDLRNEVEDPGGSLKVVDGYVDESDDTKIYTLTDEELEQKKNGICNKFTDIARACGGNQIIIKINELVKLVSVECYDKYLGALTLATAKEQDVILNQSFSEAEKNVKKWEFKKL